MMCWTLTNLVEFSENSNEPSLQSMSKLQWVSKENRFRYEFLTIDSYLYMYIIHHKWLTTADYDSVNDQKPKQMICLRNHQMV